MEYPHLINGDCLDALKKLKYQSIDSIVTDPPGGIAFMGKDWDKHKGGRDSWIVWLADIMSECNRVLKPGGDALIWSIPRTQHWTATAVENAGFEIRDVVCHLFGSGFPKSQNIGKAIDKAAGVEREVIGRGSEHYDNAKRKVKNSGFSGSDSDYGSDLEGWSPLNQKITTPATPEAKQWDGWGTNLKPAYEGWILARKPISEKTIAKNVLKHGTGGLNIDGGRVGTTRKALTMASKMPNVATGIPTEIPKELVPILMLIKAASQQI